MNIADEIRRFISRLRGVVSLREFGAVLDGVTDDLSAVQRAAADTRYATLIVDGPCYVSAPVTIPASLPVRFDANGAFSGPVTYTSWTLNVTVSPGPAAAYIKTVAQTLVNATFVQLAFDSKDYDTHNAVTNPASTWAFTVPAGYAGKYHVSVLATSYMTSGTGNWESFVSVRKNGVEVRRGGRVANPQASSYPASVASTDVDCAAGDVITIWLYMGIATGAPVVQTEYTCAQIHRIGSAATPTFSPGDTGARYTTVTSQAVGVGAYGIINFDTRDFDTNNAVTTGAAWKFTVPVGQGGKYSIGAGLSVQGAAAATGWSRLGILKNGSFFAALGDVQNTTTYQFLNGAGVFSLAPGDTISIAVFSEQARSTDASAGYQWVSIQRLGTEPVAYPTSEAWHIVGNASEPAFQSGWVNYGSGLAPAGFYKDPTGLVHLRGTMASGTIAAAMFTLPVGYRPAYNLIFQGTTAGGTGARVDVTPAGALVPQIGTNPYFAIDGISFRAEQ